MHPRNHRWWNYAKSLYPEAFQNKRVLEVGSYDINGTVREHFDGCDYVGVDWRPGPKVDVVSLAHEMPFEPASFDVVVSAQMLEHDPYWDKSIRKMVEVLKPTGYLMLSWGPAHATEAHHPEAAPDGGYHPLPARYVLDLVVSLGLYEVIHGYEAHLLGEVWDSKDEKEGDNYFVLVAAMPRAEIEEVRVSKLLLEDDQPCPLFSA